MQTMGTATFTNEAERRRVQAVVATLAQTRQAGYTAAEVAHDARNMVTALELYCDLLGDPGVLAPEFFHYASELKLVASASRRLVEKLMVLDRQSAEAGDEDEAPAWLRQAPLYRALPSQPATAAAQRLPSDSIRNLAREVEANGNLLDAMAGVSVPVTVKAEGGAHPVRLTAEDLTRVLVNLVKNAAEAMHRTGRIEIAIEERKRAENGALELVLTVDDTGPGIREGLLDQVFEPGLTTHVAEGDSGWAATHRGLGLSITRSIVEAAGGRIHAENRSEGGARIVIELPVSRR
ncbi:MAG TPA: sensor histidine kinase [Terracidiphilus sp.]|jgi:signal transduction histidine kinase|nr:sensor histidine kinase [Terracidiphilus sp.]